MPDALLQDCLEIFAHAGSDSESRRILQRYRRELIRRPDIGADLVGLIAPAREEGAVETECEVLECAIEEARMDHENAGPHGAVFLSALEEALERCAAKDTITETGTYLLGSCYVRAGLAVPKRLKRSARSFGARPAPSAAMGDLNVLLDRLHKEAGGNAYALHMALSELLATVDPELQSMLIGEMVDRDSPTYAQLGCYWLLDSSAEIRSAAADAFARRAGAGRLNAGMTSRLMELRNWLPEDAAREKLDQALTAARERDIAGGPTTRPWTLHRLLATIPDGAGAQSVAIAAQRGSERGVAMLLLKQGFGVKDAYVIPCRSATEQKQVMAQVGEESGAQDITLDLLGPLLSAALGEGQELGIPPAHGLIDVVEILGLYDLHLKAMAVEDWVNHLDPEGELSRLTPQKLGRLINASADWPERHDLIESWYEDSAAVQEILMHAITPHTRERRIWQHLETRRDWWAQLIAKAAATLKARKGGPAEDWKSVAATALALAQGRPLRKVPIMEWIAAGTFEGADDPWDVLRGRGGTESGSDESVTPVPVGLPAVEKKGELARLTKKAGMAVTPDWIDGYLAAIVVAPKLPKPSDWVGGLLENKHNFADHDELQRFFDLVMLRYNAMNADLADATATAAGIRALKGEGLQQWAQGFTRSVQRHEGHWRSKTVVADDTKVLKLIADAAEDRAGASELKPLLPAWLAQRHAKRR